MKDSASADGREAAAAELVELCQHAAERARDARLAMALLPGAQRRDALRDIAAAILAHRAAILEANAKDMAAAGGLADAMRERLRLDASRVEAMSRAVAEVAEQVDPVGKVVEGRLLASGARLEKRRIPIGVVLVIYESRPNVTSDAAAVCLKAGNAVLLKGGSEAAHSNRAIVAAIQSALERRGIAGAVQFIDTTDRAAVTMLATMRGKIDLVIPRGGPGLIRAVTEAATIPVVKHDAGNCHVYLDEHIEGLEQVAVRVTVNAKAQRPGVCNAAEKLLVHAAVAERVLPRVGAELVRAGVELRCCPRSAASLAKAGVPAKAAAESDWAEEYLALVMAVRVVDSLDEACAHIRRYGSQHTEAIITSSIAAAERFTALLDSASIMVNASTRLADGGEYGLGAEVGISTDKLHARGPMGAEDLTTFQWVLTGSGQVRG